MRVPYERVTGPEQAIEVVLRLAPQTVIVDVEPLIAHWDTGIDELDQGIDWLLGRINHVEVVVFATNSRRSPTKATPGTVYIALAGKPFRTSSYRDLPRPGVLVGDQIATDGLLARRLGYTFVHYRPPIPVPLWPRLMGHVGRIVRPLIFTR